MGTFPTFVAVNADIFPLPELEGIPVFVLLLVQLKIVPDMDEPVN